MPNQRSPDKIALSAYLPDRIKSGLLALARARGLTLTELQVEFLEEAIAPLLKRRGRRKAMLQGGFSTKR